MPEYLFLLPLLVETIDAIFFWKHHQTNLEQLVLSAVIEKERLAFFLQSEIEGQIPKFVLDSGEEEEYIPTIYLLSLITI